ncbi:aminotransferase class I/II-fold pyridoxal phosphate-dependent enzyme [Streptomyces sp. 150FB]|uniref:pyridoxal phosphate-dependent decarboxylase family protein n=1 Tax=Streptomyces sp. 150FB TaxID=1576605 RepID=UPI000A555DBA|nr:aminotransferase class I/II-fold pyridoxal phosphate-dependent enzyme [Streptomyces sp. 150FB]
MEKAHGASPRRPADALGMAPEEMRRLGHLVVDLVVDHFETRADGPAIQQSTPEELRAVLGGPVPRVPGDADAAIRTLVGTALANMQHGDHPRYFARVPGPSSFAAVLGEWLATGHNAIATSWGGGSGPTTVELVVIDWLRELLGMPDGTEGILVSGGSLANLTAFAAARAELGDGVVYLTDQTHSSIPRGLRALGFPPDRVRVLRSDGGLRMPVGELAAAVAADRAAGRRPVMVVATAGTTNTGAVDPLPEIADLCRAEGMWFHVDGAYGAPAALSAAGAAALVGIERADSLVIDPHKWLFQPYDVGCVLVRRPGALERAFSIDAEYLRDTSAAGGEVNLRDRSLELSRRSRALKLWLTFTVHGVEGIRSAIARGIALAEFAEGRLRADPMWEVVTPARLGVVTFALIHGADGTHAARAAALATSGYAAVTSTTVRGRSVLRLCTINPATTEDDIVRTLDRLAAP